MFQCAVYNSKYNKMQIEVAQIILSKNIKL